MVLFLSIVILSVLYFCGNYLLQYIYSYWHRKGNIPYIKPHIPYGNLQYIGNHEQLGLLLKRLYTQLKGKGQIGGIYILYRPFAIALHTNFIKNMLIRDFNHFEDRGLYYNEKTDPISAHLINVNADKWHTLRRIITPNFTTGKMKFMFPTIMTVSKQLELYLQNKLSEDADNHGKKIEIRSLLNGFTIDVISSCAFGIDSNSLTNPNNEFRTMGIKSFEKRKIPIVLSILLASHQTLAKKIGLKLFAKDVSDFFTKIVCDAIWHRQKSGKSRNDFIDLVLKLKKSDGTNMLTQSEIVAQSFVFFIAGFDTSATTLTYALWEMAKNADIQIKLRKEIKETMDKYNGQFTYEAMLDMPYLDQVIYEVLRKHPPVGQLMRRVTKDYQIPDTDTVLPKGLTVFVPLYAIHHDPEIYPNPDVFDPERFSSTQTGQKQDLKEVSFLSFGHGPRNCIGTQFGMMIVRIGLMTILLNNRIESCEETPDIIEYSTNNIMMVPKAGIHLRFAKISD